MSLSDPTTPKESTTVSRTNTSNGIKDMESALQTLRHVAEEDKTEMGHLRSRLEEQSKLIAVLKKRADDVGERKCYLEALIDELTTYKENAKDQLEREQKKHIMLEARFTELAHNHEDMIKFKNECKKQNDLLRKENASLKLENSRRTNEAMSDRDKEISEIETESRVLRERVTEEREKNMRMKAKLEEDFAKCQASVADLRKNSTDKIAELNTEIKNSKEKRCQLEAQLKTNSELREKLLQEMRQNEESVRKERDEMRDLAKHREQLLREKTSEVKRVEEKVKAAEIRLRETQENLESHTDEYSVASQTRQLRAQYSQGLETYDQLTKQFDAFKKHSTSLLETEKELNARLQKLNS